MRESLKLLDCTLRDGGYINDWRFGNLTIRSIVSRLDNSGIDIIECGFLDSRTTYDKNRSMYPDIPSVAKTLANSLPKRAMLVAMIDFGTFNSELLIPKDESVLDGIRLIFKKEKINEALDYAKKIKCLGYLLFLNPVALTSYHDMELLQLVEKINLIQPYGMSIVDTYGLMFDSDVEKYVYLLDSNLNPDIALGYHTHNNLQMGNAHCISFINNNIQRTKVVDFSVLGMGKNAGNACTELVSSYVNKVGIKDIDLDQIFECAYTDITKFNTAQNWGYGLDTLLSAIHDCSPNWIKYLMSKKTISIKGISTILNALPFEKREVSYFTEDVAERKYLEYMNKYVDDAESKAKFQNRINGRKIMLLCPGKTLLTHRSEIDMYIEENNPIIISVSFMTNEFNTDYAFISNSNRYSQMLGIYPELDRKPTVIITSNIVTTDGIIPEFIFNYKSLYDRICGDNSTVLLMTLLRMLDINNIAVAGMDGFDITNFKQSLYDDDLSLGNDVNANNVMVEQLRHALDGNPNLIKWITPSKIKEALFSNV